MGTMMKTTRTVKVVEGDRKRKCRRCCRKFTAFLFSHIGLSSLVVAYAVLGAFIFMNLEASHEQKERIRMTEVRKTLVKKLWNITLSMNVFYPENWTAEADRVFRQFQDRMYHAVKWDGWDGQDASEEPKWSFIGALLYSVTIITTIGYGHITPKTVYGRMATIGYAIVGIPLTLLCLANLGTLFGNCFRFLYKHICRAIVWCFCPAQIRGAGAKLSRQTGLASTGSGGLRSAEEGEVTYVTDDVDKELEEKEEKRVRVPMIVSLLVIALYIIAGAVLFSFWEKDWDMFIGAYFCFITLSTIGFGDFVPGFEGGWSKEKTVFNAIYLIFGLALIAMCFNLMQEEVRTKCAWLARKLRLIKTTHKATAAATHSPMHRADVGYCHLREKVEEPVGEEVEEEETCQQAEEQREEGRLQEEGAVVEEVEEAEEGYDVMAATSPGAEEDGEDEETDREPEGRESTTSGGGDQDDRGPSAFSKPRPNSAMGNKLQKQPSKKRKPSYENVMPPRCVSPMPKPMRSPSPKRVDTPASLSSSTSTEVSSPAAATHHAKAQEPRAQ
nr:hypothetical protein BaRGS_002841 [Batillaria attramentaria]